MAAESGSWKNGARSERNDEEVVITRVSPPPSKRSKIDDDEDVVYVDREEPLRCSTPQLEASCKELPGDDLDATLEELGISHDSIVNETGEHELLLLGLNNEYAEAFLREEEGGETTLVEETASDTTTTNGKVVGEERVERDNSLVRGSEVAGVPEIVEEILGLVPIPHLYSSCRLVCQKWNNIILREKFLYWKKMYYRYKSGRCSQSQQTVTSIIRRVWSPTSDAISLKTITVPLIRFVSEQFPHLDLGGEFEKELLHHPQSCCVTRIRELFPSVDSSKGSKAVTTAALLVLCSRGVPEVHTVIACFIASPFKRLEVMEVFYCLATLCLYGCHEVKKMPMSDSSSKELTAEQSQVVNHKLEPGEVIKVMAFAGTGKTTTLLQFTALNPNLSFLYCVYNKSVQEHAATIFPRNVKCRTFHSLAHGSRGDPVSVGWKYFSKRGSVNSYHISQCVKPPKDQSLYPFCRYILQTVERFIASGDHEFQDEHIPTTINKRRRRNEGVTSEEHAAQVRQLNDPTYRVHIFREAMNIWKTMIDTKDKAIKMSDDGYLKLFQLSQPQIYGYDCILVDEAQDLTPAIISLITSQTCCKIFVGDTHQQIYGFRGATNALEQISTNRVFHLTESFRFGPKIAYVAACTLSVLKGVWRQTLIGSTHKGRLDGVKEGQVAIIARMNITLFDEMVKTVRSGTALKLGFAGGIQKYDFDMYLDLHKLQHGRKSEITHRFVKHWKSFDSLAKFAEKTDDVSLLNKIKICQKYQNLPYLIEKIKSMHSKDLSHADIVFSTAHKSKGLEFDTVTLTDDYLGLEEEDRHSLSPGEESQNFYPPDIEEGNILYVAVTRAKKSLILTRTLATLLKDAGEHFVYPSVEHPEMSEGICSVCRLHYPYPPLRLQSEALNVTGQIYGYIFNAGMVCIRCSSVTLPFLHTQPQ